MRLDFLFKILPVVVLFCAIGSVGAVAAVDGGVPTLAWQKLLGGRDSETGLSVQQTADGGYVLLGSSYSSASGDVTGTSQGYLDFWIVKLDRAGALQWEKLLGGNYFDEGKSVQQTADGGFILLGSSGSSAGGDVAGTNHGKSDMWVVKLNSTGAIQWEQLLGGSSSEGGTAIQQTADGGYILLGSSGSSASGDVTGTNHGQNDIWVVKLNSTGAIQWEQLLGGSSSEEGTAIQQTADGGYVLVGSSYSSADGNVTGTNNGQVDFWVVKLNDAGQIQWDRLIGGSDYDVLYSVRQAADGGFVLLGTSDSSASGNVTAANHGGSDFWVVKLNDAGQIQWDRLLGGSDYDNGYSVQQTADGGFVLLGYSSSSESGDVIGTTHGGLEMWIVKLDGAGSLEWQRLLGGSNTDYGNSVRQTADGGYVLLGFSRSSLSGDVTGKNHGGDDFWVVKLNAEVPGVSLIPGGAGAPGDTDVDGLYEDVNGNGRKDFADVVLYFNQMTWIAGHEPVPAFDYNGNGRIDFADVVMLFNSL